MPEVVDPTVEVNVDEFAAVDVPDPVALPAADDQVDADVAQEAHPVRAQVLLGQVQGFLLVHMPAN